MAPLFQLAEAVLSGDGSGSGGEGEDEDEDGDEADGRGGGGGGGGGQSPLAGAKRSGRSASSTRVWLVAVHRSEADVLLADDMACSVLDS